MDYPGASFDRIELAAIMQKTYDELIEFADTDSFRSVYSELMSLPRTARPNFVLNVLLNPDELSRRGIRVPEGILIQVSAFGDRRPTLFAIKKFLPPKYHCVWENVNLTFDNEWQADVPRDAEFAWRPPLPAALQMAMMEAGIDLEAAPPEFGVIDLSGIRQNSSEVS